MPANVMHTKRNRGQSPLLLNHRIETPYENLHTMKKLIRLFQANTLVFVFDYITQNEIMENYTRRLQKKFVTDYFHWVDMSVRSGVLFYYLYSPFQ